MKVTVCFDSVRVVVPCGDGRTTISDLTEQAIARYKKAVAKTQNQDVWVTVHNLKSSDGGIFDPDDNLIDIVDDKEQIFATFDVSYQSFHHNNGDGTSASSVGTSSPDVCHSNKDNDMVHHWSMNQLHAVILTEKDIEAESSLTVRRESDPSLQHLIKSDLPAPHHQRSLLNFDPKVIEHKSKKRKTQKITKEGVGSEGVDSPDENEGTIGDFARSSARKSINNGTSMMQWLEAQERTQAMFYMKNGRQDPIGSSDEIDMIGCEVPLHGNNNINSHTGTLIELPNSGGPLGIHVTPCIDDNQSFFGLEIIEIESEGRVCRDGRLRLHDCIVEINGTSLVGLDYERAQEIFRLALRTSKILLLIKSTQSCTTMSTVGSNASPMATTTEKEAVNVQMTSEKPMKEKEKEKEKKEDLMKNGMKKQSTTVEKREECNGSGMGANRHESSPTNMLKMPPAPPVRSATTTLQTVKPKFTPTSNTRVIGTKMNIELVKGAKGLGFSVTTRDNAVAVGGDCPIYVKNILPEGAAIVDGCLQPGDRLLAVDGIEMSGKSQSDAVAVLRNIKIGSSVVLVISRQVEDEKLEDSGGQPPVVVNESEKNANNQSENDNSFNQLETATNNQSEKQAISEQIQRTTEQILISETIKMPPNVQPDVLTLNIAFDGLRSAQGQMQGTSLLGISVKGRTLQNGQDVGLYVKEIFNGGAAAKDGRLRADDRLIKVNGVLLDGFANPDAMEILRQELQKDYFPGGSGVTLTVSRPRYTLAKMDAQENNHQEFAVPTSRTKKPQAKNGGESSPTISSSVQKMHKTKGHKMNQDSEGGKDGRRTLRNISYQIATNDGDVDVEDVETVRARTSNTTVSLTNNFASHAGSSYEAAETGGRTSVTTEITCSQDSRYSSLEQPKTFDREGIGRRSMSEKRKAYIDPKSTTFFQNRKTSQGKKTTLKRSESIESIIGRSTDAEGHSSFDRLNQKRSNSLESLQNAPVPSLPRASRMSSKISDKRNRAWNDSFRTAVDHSYSLAVSGQGQGYSQEQQPYGNGASSQRIHEKPPFYGCGQDVLLVAQQNHEMRHKNGIKHFETRKPNSLQGSIDRPNTRNAHTEFRNNLPDRWTNNERYAVTDANEFSSYQNLKLIDSNFRYDDNRYNNLPNPKPTNPHQMLMPYASFEPHSHRQHEAQPSSKRYHQHHEQQISPFVPTTRLSPNRCSCNEYTNCDYCRTHRYAAAGNSGKHVEDSFYSKRNAPIRNETSSARVDLGYARNPLPYGDIQTNKNLEENVHSLKGFVPSHQSTSGLIQGQNLRNARQNNFDPSAFRGQEESGSLNRQNEKTTNLLLQNHRNNGYVISEGALV